MQVTMEINAIFSSKSVVIVTADFFFQSLDNKYYIHFSKPDNCSVK